MQVQVGTLPTWITYSVDIAPNPLLKEGFDMLNKEKEKDSKVLTCCVVALCSLVYYVLYKEQIGMILEPNRLDLDYQYPVPNLYVCKMGLVHRTDSSEVGVFPSQDVLLLQENFPTWTPESTVAMTTLCHNYCLHLNAVVNQLVCIRSPEMYVSNILCVLI